MARTRMSWVLGIGIVIAAVADAGESAADRVAAIADTTLDHHILSPTRQEMILHGLRAVYEKAGVPAPDQLARRISAAGAGSEAALIGELWPREVASGASKEDLE